METFRVLSIDIGILNLAYCIVDFHKLPSDDFEFTLVHAEKACIGSTRQSMCELMENAIEFFENAVHIQSPTRDIHTVFIERQLTRATKNNVLAFVVMTYFRSYRYHKTHFHSSFVHPLKKFDAVKHVFQASAPLDRVDFKRTGTKELKKLSVELALLIFDHFQCATGKQAIEKYTPKTDDICDVFLQSFVFLYWNRRLIAGPTANDSA